MKKLILLACCLITIAGHAQLGNQMVVCMPMDNSSTNDFSGYNNHGSIVVHSGGGITPVAGHLNVSNTALNFSGGSFINIPTSPSIDGIETNDELSISIWCKVNAWHSSSQVFPMVERWHSTSDDGWQFNLLNSSVFNYDMHFGNGLAMLNVYTGNVSIQVGTGVWQHFVMVYSKAGNYCDLYVNGTLIANHTPLTTPQLFNTMSGDIRIGFSEAGINEYANGDMDDLRIWRRAITPAEVSSLYNDQTLTCASGSVTPDPDPDPVENGCCLGNECGSSPNPLLNDYQIPMGGFNFNYTMQNGSSSKVIIGQSACGTGFARLDVRDDNIGTGVKGYCATSNPESIGVFGSGEFIGGDDPNSLAIGVVGDGKGRDVEQKRQYGVVGFAGSYNSTAMPPTPENVGVYGNALHNNGSWAGYFDGHVYINGPSGAGGGGAHALKVAGSAWLSGSLIQNSDLRYKTAIKPLQNVSEKLEKLGSYTYNFKTSEFKNKNFPETEQIGLIAQEVQEVFPQLVAEEKDGYLGVNYQGMVPVLLQALKEQNEINRSQQQQIEELKELVNKMVALNSVQTSNGTANSVPIHLSDKNTVVLNQNVPNPFAESTVITYNIPENFSKAQIVFMTNDGRVIKSVDIREKGQGSLSVFADDLTNGIYSYTLVIDGKTIDTKKMIKN